MRGPPRPRALRARSMRCWQTRATRSRRASHACSAARTRTPTRRRGMLRPAARSERLRLRGQRSGGRAHAPGFFGRRGLRVSTRAAAIFWLGCVRTSPCRCASLGYYVCVLRQAWARVRVAHVRMRSAPACVPWCVSREGGQSSGACCGCGASRMSGVARRRESMPVCVHASLPPSLLGRPSVIGYREARPCQARVVRTLYSCEARRWVHGTQRGEGSCARCVRTMRIMLCYVMLCAFYISPSAVRL